MNNNNNNNNNNLTHDGQQTRPLKHRSSNDIYQYQDNNHLINTSNSNINTITKYSSKIRPVTPDLTSTAAAAVAGTTTTTTMIDKHTLV